MVAGRSKVGFFLRDLRGARPSPHLNSDLASSGSLGATSPGACYRPGPVLPTVLQQRCEGVSVTQPPRAGTPELARLAVHMPSIGS